MNGVAGDGILLLHCSRGDHAAERQRMQRKERDETRRDFCDIEEVARFERMGRLGIGERVWKAGASRAVGHGGEGG